MPYQSKQKPEFLERSMAALCYLSCGLIGLIYILLSGKYSNTSFFRFHFLQSIVLGILTYLLGWAGNIVRDILVGIFGLIVSVFPPAAGIIAPVTLAIGLIIGLINKAALLLLIYGCIYALLGKYAEIPGLSKLVYRQIR
jgi:uncharacterized membrane protein